MAAWCPICCLAPRAVYPGLGGIPFLGHVVIFPALRLSEKGWVAGAVMSHVISIRLLFISAMSTDGRLWCKFPCDLSIGRLCARSVLCWELAFRFKTYTVRSCPTFSSCTSRLFSQRQLSHNRKVNYLLTLATLLLKLTWSTTFRMCAALLNLTTNKSCQFLTTADTQDPQTYSHQSHNAVCV